MGPGQAGVQEWSLYWTTRGQPVPSTLVPALGDWLDIDDREDRADIHPRTPILVDPQYRIDSVLARFFSRSRFAALAEGTREAYAKDYRLFFSYLWSHRSEQTTRMIYLEPLNGLQLRSMLDHDEDLETLLSRVAAASRLVMDVDLGEQAG